MSKTRSFSIFLLKEDFDTPARALNPDHGLKEATHTKGVENPWPTYLATKAPAAPWWAGYFGINDQIAQRFAGAIVFVKASNRTFALTLGHTRHHLRDEAYEYDFGLRTTLNAVDPNEIRNTDELDPATSRRRRTQLPERSDINYFDFAKDSSVLKSLTGAIRSEYKHLFSHASGASNLRVSTKKLLPDLPLFLEEVYGVYQKETYLVAFPSANNIQPVKDPNELRQLDHELEQAVRASNENVVLTIPDMVDFLEDFQVSFRGAGPSDLYPDTRLEDYYAWLAVNGRNATSLQIRDLRNHRLELITEDGAKKGNYSIYKSLVFETALDGQNEAYHLSEGTWYRVEADYLKTLANDIDTLFIDAGLPARTVHTEAEYNELQLAPHWTGSVLLDRTSMSPESQKQVEPCDVVRAEDKLLVLTHVKVGVNASSLSHLFNQGVNSIELLNSVEAVRANLQKLITERNPNFDLSGLLDREFKVEYVIVTKNEKELKSAALPLFSRISLRRAHRSLTSMKVETSVTLAGDEYVGTTNKKTRTKRKSKSETTA